MKNRLPAENNEEESEEDGSENDERFETFGDAEEMELEQSQISVKTSSTRQKLQKLQIATKGLRKKTIIGNLTIQRIENKTQVPTKKGKNKAEPDIKVDYDSCTSSDNSADIARMESQANEY